MESYDLDEDSGAASVDRAAPGVRLARRGLRRRWWVALAGLVLVLVIAPVAVGADERSRGREFDALVHQVTLGQSAVRYSDAGIQSMVQYTSPQLTSARTPANVRASLRKIVQQAAADRLEPMRIRRDAVAGLPVRRWHGEQRQARDAYLAYLDRKIALLRTVSVDLRALYQPHPENERALAVARDALLKLSPDAPSSTRMRNALTGPSPQANQ
jgi:hypothetical protein